MTDYIKTTNYHVHNPDFITRKGQKRMESMALCHELWKIKYDFKRKRGNLAKTSKQNIGAKVRDQKRKREGSAAAAAERMRRDPGGEQGPLVLDASVANGGSLTKEEDSSPKETIPSASSSEYSR
ncbi:hypothetical protein GWI33_002414 [Rhynchophorus ferrugineus]|uniref:Uncharacterized protein n=1 Tax=Rhynchophorus ferrugineus TaxID=354439 RepID=A0A834IV63_RHYFE|nr:hypothetical protein GWI33_002414 [Rhynchophorus ferrugineus]